MNLAFGVLFLWMGAGALYIASHGLGGGTPWGVFSALLDKMRSAA
jgi:hypothetical protein